MLDKCIIHFLRRILCTGPIGDFFSANEDCISANHMARILIWRRISLTSRKHLQYVYAHVHVRTMYLKYAPYDWLKYWGMAILVCRQKNRRPTGKPLLLLMHAQCACMAGHDPHTATTAAVRSCKWMAGHDLTSATQQPPLSLCGLVNDFLKY